MDRSPLRIVFVCFFFCLFELPTAFSQGEIVRVSGMILNEDDSSGVAVSIYYEKLPYYDDMGMASSAADGSFEFMLIKDVSYIFRIDNIPGQASIEREISVTDPEEDNAMDLIIFIPKPEEPVEEPAEELITLDNLNFASGRANIDPGSYKGLDDFVTYLNERPNIIIQLEGHTDFEGGADANLRLSQARVDAVAEYLIDKGIKKNRVKTKAFGGTQPLTTDRTPEGKAMNRRVEVRLTRIN